MAIAIKAFEVEENSTPGMRYRIVVKFKGRVVDEFVRDTMLEAKQAFESAGYQLTALAGVEAEVERYRRMEGRKK